MEQPLLSPLITLILLLIFLTTAFLINILTKIKNSKENKLLPRPWRLPIIDNLHLLNPNKPHHSLISLSNKHGPLMLLQLGSIPTLVISSRYIAEEIFTNHDLTFSCRPLLTAPKMLMYNNSSIAFSPHGDYWHQARKILMLELLSHHRVRSFKAVRAEEVEKLVTAIKDLLVVNLSELMLSFANDVICRVAVGDAFGDGGYGREGVRLHQLLSETQSLLAGFCVADFFPWMEWVDRLRGFHRKLKKNFEKVDGFFDRVILAHIKKEEEEKEKSSNSIIDSDEKNDLVGKILRLESARRFMCGLQ